MAHPSTPPTYTNLDSPASIKWRTQRLPICLRFTTIIASLAAVISFGYTQGLHDREVVTSPDLGQHLITPVTGTTEYAFIWSLIIFSVELATPIPFHPGIYIAFDFIAFAAVSVALCLYLALMEPYFTGGYTCGRLEPDCDGKQAANVEFFGTAMGFVAVIIHFGFFVWACRATDKLRKSQRVAKDAAC
ncbi:hypothetical protein BJY01DRAFT_107169 [Aspergillus pseudoustus]|uniref:MARVEL domain-containing protein n=1 Tax=Aspergillus pseudoustus TaxID=1810923 RepID=A0ABR4KIJ6_9EURO